jgi:hypothetical protein
MERYNIFWVGTTCYLLVQLSVGLQIVPSIADSNFHHLFYQREWLLMPEDYMILEKYYESLTRVGSELEKTFSGLSCMPSY